MSGILKTISAGSLRVDGVETPFGRGTSDYVQSTIPSTNLIRMSPWKLDPGEIMTVWDSSWFLRFDLVEIVVESATGVLDIAWLTDAPTSNTNFAASGSRPRWRFGTVAAGKGPFRFTSDQQLGHATLATEVSSNGSAPALWTSALGAAALDKLYTILVGNRGAAAVDGSSVVVGY